MTGSIAQQFKSFLTFLTTGISMSTLKSISSSFDFSSSTKYKDSLMESSLFTKCSIHTSEISPGKWMLSSRIETGPLTRN